MPDIGKDIRPPTAEDYRSHPLTVPSFPGTLFAMDGDSAMKQQYDTYAQYKAQTGAIQMAQMQNMAQSIPAVYLSPPPKVPAFLPVPPADIESPHWVSRARWRPYMFAILSPLFLPLLLVYTLVRGIRAWGQFVGELCEGLVRP